MALNANGRTWAAGIGAAAVVALGSWAWNSVTGKVDAVQTVQASRGERITKVEAEIVALKEGLGRIERKLDQVLERK